MTKEGANMIQYLVPNIDMICWLNLKKNVDLIY